MRCQTLTELKHIIFSSPKREITGALIRVTRKISSWTFHVQGGSHMQVTCSHMSLTAIVVLPACGGNHGTLYAAVCEGDLVRGQVLGQILGLFPGRVHHGRQGEALRKKIHDLGHIQLQFLGLGGKADIIVILNTTQFILGGIFV